jgi:hypothetical protein
MGGAAVAGGGTTSDGGQAAGCDITSLLRLRCAGAPCHSPGQPSANLDLLSPRVEARLVNVPSHECSGQLRVDPARPNDSLLLQKLEGRQKCGRSMPLGQVLTNPAELACFRSWIEQMQP